MTYQKRFEKKKGYVHFQYDTETLMVIGQSCVLDTYQELIGDTNMGAPFYKNKLLHSSVLFYFKCIIPIVNNLVSFCR